MDIKNHTNYILIPKKNKCQTTIDMLYQKP